MTQGRDSLIIFIAGVILFAVGLPDEFVGFQCRFGLFAKEMLWNGPTFFPTVYGHAYPDYPGTSTFLVYLLARLFGKVTPFLTILPGAIASAMVLVFTYRIGALRSRRWGLYAVFMTLFTYEFAVDSRTISLDQYTSLATVFCFWLVYSSFVLGKTGRLWLVPAILAAGFAFRGPIGLAIPAAVTCAFYLWPLNIRRLAVFAATAVVVACACVAAYLAMARAQGGEALARTILASQAADRLTDHPIAWYFYITDGMASCALAYPVAILVITAVVCPNLRRIDPDFRLLGSLALWAVILVVGLSIPAAKKMRYLLPAIPAFALIAAWVFAADEPGLLLRRVRDSLMGFFLWLPVGLFLATLVLLSLGYRFGLEAQASLLVPAIVLLVWATAAFYVHFRPRDWRQAACTAIAAAAFVTFMFGVAEPLTAARGSSRNFRGDLEAIRQVRPGPLVFFRMGPDGEDVKYASNLDYQISPSFIESLDQMTRVDPAAYIVAFAADYAALPRDIAVNCDVVARGRIGHKDCIAFRAPQ